MKLTKCFAIIAVTGVAFLAGALWGQGPRRQDTSPVVAVVDGKNVTLDEYKHILSIAPPQIANVIRVDPVSGLMGWFVTLHLAQEAEAMKLDQQSPTKEQIDAVRSMYLADARVNAETNHFQVTPEMEQKYYAAHLSDFQRVHATGVLIRYKAEAPKVGATSAKEMEAALKAAMGNKATRSESEAKAAAEEIAKRLRAGEDMKSLVAKHSEDESSKAQGGDLGWVSSESKHTQEFRIAVLALAKGAVSGPIAVPGGFYVVRADDRGTSPMSDVTNDIVVTLRQQHMNEFVEKVRTRFAPKIVDPTLLQAPSSK